MDRPETVAQLLNTFGVTSERPLGSGQESDVFAINDQRVLRLYRGAFDQRHLARLAKFYTQLDRRDAPFMVPEMIEFGERDGIAYAVEVRVSGIDLAKALGRKEGEARFQAIRNYVDAAAAVRSLKHRRRNSARSSPPALSAAKPGPSSSSPAPSNVWASTVIS